MKNILPAIITVLAIGLSAMYFTSAKPVAQALTEDEASVIFTIFRRIQRVEKLLPEEVPEDLKVYINCPEDLKAQGKCVKE